MGYLRQSETHGSGALLLFLLNQRAHPNVQRLKENAKHLQIRPENFGHILEVVGFGPAEHLGAAGEGGKLIAGLMLHFHH